MIWPPSLLRLRVENRDHQLRLWLPLFIVWPLVLALGILLMPLAIVLAILLWPSGWGKPVLLGGPMLFRIFCALRGLEVKVEGVSQQVHIAFR